MVGLVAALLCAVPRPAAGGDPYRDVSRSLVEGLLALLPVVEGYVVSTSGGEVYVDLSRKDLVKPGMELQVYRPGAEMIHPVTRQVLGAYENDLGVLSLTEVREKYSRGTLDARGASAGVVAADRVRLSSRRLRTLLHVAGAADGIEIGPLAQALIARGEQSGRFTMIDEPAWVPSLTALGGPWEAVRADPSRLRRLGELATADLLLLARIEPGAVSGVALELRSLRTGTLLGELREPWPAPAKVAVPAVGAPVAPVAAAVTPTAAPTAAAQEPEPAAVSPVPVTAIPAPAPDDYIVRELSAPARALAAGNILGEGQLEVVLTDGARLSLYRWGRLALVSLWDEDARGGRRILSLDAADCDGDGRPEVLVTVIVRGRVTSEMRRWRDGALQVEATIDGVYLRAAPPALLLGQRAGFDEVLSGRVEQYRLRAGTFERIDGSALPGGVGIFGLALAPAGGPVAFYTLDRGGFLSGLTPEGAVVWGGTRPYGGYPPPLTAIDLFGTGAVEEQGFDDEVRAFQGRLLAEATAGGIRLVVPRNYSDSPVLLARQRARGQGEIVILAGPVGSPEEIRRSRVFNGYVADLARADIDGDGNPEVLFVVNRIAGTLQGERGKLVAWRPGGVPDSEK